MQEPREKSQHNLRTPRKETWPNPPHKRCHLAGTTVWQIYITGLRMFSTVINNTGGLRMPAVVC